MKRRRVTCSPKSVVQKFVAKNPQIAQKEAQISFKDEGERKIHGRKLEDGKNQGFQRWIGLPSTYVLVRHRKLDTNPPLIAALMTVC
jgi:hypothetical protein